MRIIVILLGIGLFLCPWPAAAATGAPAVYRQLNLARSTHSRSQLVLSTRLSAVAQQRAQLMGSLQRLAHSFAGQPSTWEMIRQTKYTYTNGGEVISANQYDPKKIVRSWELSTVHRTIVLGQKYNQVGVGEVRVRNGEKLVVITVAILAYHPKNTP